MLIATFIINNAILYKLNLLYEGYNYEIKKMVNFRISNSNEY